MFAHFGPYNKQVVKFDLRQDGAELWIGIKGNPEQIARLKDFLLDSPEAALPYELARMKIDLPPQREVLQKTKPCEKWQGPLLPTSTDYDSSE